MSDNVIKVNYQNKIVVPNTSPVYERLKELLTIVTKEYIIKKQYDRTLHRLVKRSVSQDSIHYLYIEQNNNLYIPYGLYNYLLFILKNEPLKYYGIIEHPLLNENNVNNVINHIEDYRTIIDDISLYDIQLNSTKQIFINKRGVIQAPTGSGKTEIMCAALKIMKQLNNDKYPTTLILEPTIELLNGIKRRLKKYGIAVNDYRETRAILTNKINIAHPKSLINDLQVNNKLLNKIEVQFMDECHHSSCSTWCTPTYNMPNLIYSIGLSATFLEHTRINGQTIYDFTFEELKRIGCLGPLIYVIKGNFLIDEGILATPKLCIIHNEADEKIDLKKYDYEWNTVKKIRMQSEKRTRLIAEAAGIFLKYNYKVLILMNLLDWGRRIMYELYNLGYADCVRTCYGGQKYEKIKPKTGKIDKEWNNALKLFDTDKINCIIGSSCIQEGIDLSKVDVCILAQGGKKDRTALQSFGRALRKSKTGKFSWLVDIDDTKDRMLYNQYCERMKKYKNVLGLDNKDNVFKNLSIEELENIFKKYEELK